MAVLLLMGYLVFVINTTGVRRTGAKGEKIMYDIERKINEAVFPGLQGGPHDNVIAGSYIHFLC